MQERYQIKPYQKDIIEYRVKLDNGESYYADVYPKGSKHWHLSQILEVCVLAFEMLIVVLTVCIILFADVALECKFH